MADRNVLIVDDEAPILSALARVARRAGYRALLFTDGEEALEALDAQGLELAGAIVDHNMPTLDGLELARALKARTPSLRILMLSGGIPGAEVVAAKEEGLLWGYAEKPWELDWMRRALRALVEGDPPPAV